MLDEYKDISFHKPFISVDIISIISIVFSLRYRTYSKDIRSLLTLVGSIYV